MVSRELLAEVFSHAIETVNAGVLVRANVCLNNNTLEIAGYKREIGPHSEIKVIGAGKAAAHMVYALLDVLAPINDRVSGLVNSPSGFKTTDQVVIHAAAPADENRPHKEGVEGALKMLEIAKSVKRDDILIVLITGGGSALLPCPPPGITLEDKQKAVEIISNNGGDIKQMNVVRKALSLIKGGRLAQAVPDVAAGNVFCLVVSDVIGDPLTAIASGPMVSCDTSARDALEILRRYDSSLSKTPASVVQYLLSIEEHDEPVEVPEDKVITTVIGNIKVARNSARKKAEALGLKVFMIEEDVIGDAKLFGEHLAKLALESKSESKVPTLIIAGGEPTVNMNNLPPASRKGGRAQQVVLSAACSLGPENIKNILICGIGTDGRDGPKTDAAGAFADELFFKQCEAKGLDPVAFLNNCDEYPLFEQTDSLIKLTQATKTNVNDLYFVYLW